MSAITHGMDIQAVRKLAGQMIARIRDVDAETRARLELQRSEERLRAAMRSTPVGMAIVTRSGRFLQVNEALCRIMGKSERALVGATVTSLSHPDDHDIDLEMWNLLHSGATRSVTRDKRLVDSGGRAVWVQQSLAIVTDDDGENSSFVAQFMDITQAQEARAVLDFQANHDPLTDLKNRRAVINTITAVLSHPPRSGTDLGILYCDVDRFKPINDTYGHPVGDELLVEIARRIRRCVRSGDTVGRIGGDEFVVVLTQIHGIDDAVRIGNAILEQVSQAVVMGDVEIMPTMSIGAAVAIPGDDPDAVLANADRALYRAKQAGRNRLEADLSP